MARKSAKSKGYRKQAAKKPYLSKRDIAILCVLIVAVAIGAILLFRYDDGALKLKDGAVVTEGDNWLIVNGSNVRGRARYFKLGEMGEIEGYTREAHGIVTDANVPEYAFTPVDEAAGITSITATASHSGAEALAKFGTESLAAIEGTSVGDTVEADINGHAVQYYIYTSEYAVAEEAEEAAKETAEVAEATEEAAEEAAEESEGSDEAAEDADDASDDTAAKPNRFTKSLSGYFDAGHDSCIAIHVESSAESADGYLADDALTEALAQAVMAVTLEEGK